MKKIALSLLVIAASGAYVWQQAATAPNDTLLGSMPPAGGAATAGSDLPRRLPASTANVPALAPQLVPFVEPATPLPSEPLQPIDAPPLPIIHASGNGASAPGPSVPVVSTASADVPRPRPRPIDFAAQAGVTRAAMKVAQNVGYADGAYTGPPVDAYYGLVQIQAVVQGGRLTAIKVLQYPSDRRTSVAINRQALPMLRDEVIMAQSANVDIISGATLTSEAFLGSLDAALQQAGTT